MKIREKSELYILEIREKPLDFAKESVDIKNNFIENMDDLDTFFRNLFLLKKKSFRGKNCVIIFDEVQLLPMMQLKMLLRIGNH